MQSSESSPPRPSRRRWQTILDAVTSLVMLGAALVMIGSYVMPAKATRQAVALPKEPVSLDGAAIRGNRSARVAILEFSDFECPFCGRFARETMPALDDAYVKKGRAFLAFRHLPLSMHPLAPKAAQAAECAGRQGKFWEAHDRMYEEPQRLQLADLLEAPRSLDLDKTQFESCMAAQAGDQVQKDVAEAQRLGVKSTPVFLLGTVQPDGRLRAQRLITGARTFKEFQTAIDTILGAETR